MFVEILESFLSVFDQFLTNSLILIFFNFSQLLSIFAKAQQEIRAHKVI